MTRKMNIPPLTRAVSEYCYSEDFLNIFLDFFESHVYDFDPSDLSEEHSLKQYSIFQKYLALYESTLTKRLISMDSTPRDFYRELDDIQEKNIHIDDKVKHFIKCLHTSAQYESFYEVMVEAYEYLKHSPRAQSKKPSTSISTSKYTYCYHDNDQSSSSDECKLDMKPSHK